MLVLNFSHPLTDENKTQIGALSETTVDEIRAIPVQVDDAAPLETQIRVIVDAVQLTSEEWQTRPLLINAPGYSPAALVLLAELHGRMGYFPSLIHLRAKAGAITSYEVVELLNLQAIRGVARARR